MNGALTASGLGSLPVETPTERAHTLTIGFMDLGLDSHDATVVIQRLNSELQTTGGEKLSASTFLEYPSPLQLAQHLHERYSTGGVNSPMALALANAKSGLLSSDTLIEAASCEGRLPGKAYSTEQAAKVIQSTADMIGELALTRWPNTRLSDGTVDRHVRYGGVLDGAMLFDSSLFGVSVAEASAMDPQQRMLLESGYESLFKAGMPRAQLTGADTAVHVGLMNSDFAEPFIASGGVYAATGARPSVAAGRISYVLGLMGPCTTIDTACSSALAAVDFSRLHLLAGHAATALAAAVNVLSLIHI